VDDNISPEESSLETGADKGEKPQANAAKVADEEQREGPKRLYRSREHRMIAGIAGGIAEYLGVDPTLIRLLFVLSIFAGGAGLVAYIVAWIIIPERPQGERAPEVPNSNLDAGLLVGLILVGLGLWFLLNNLGFVPEPFFVLIRILRATFWPVTLIIIGVAVIVATTRNRGQERPAPAEKRTSTPGSSFSAVHGKTLYRSRGNRMIAGVAGGMAEYFGVDPTLIRLAWVVLAIINIPAAVIAYIVAAIVIPEKPVSQPGISKEEVEEAEGEVDGENGEETSQGQ